MGPRIPQQGRWASATWGPGSFFLPRKPSSRKPGEVNTPLQDTRRRTGLFLPQIFPLSFFLLLEKRNPFHTDPVIETPVHADDAASVAVVLIDLIAPVALQDRLRGRRAHPGGVGRAAQCRRAGAACPPRRVLVVPQPRVRRPRRQVRRGGQSEPPEQRHQCHAREAAPRGGGGGRARAGGVLRRRGRGDGGGAGPGPDEARGEAPRGGAGHRVGVVPVPQGRRHLGLRRGVRVPAEPHGVHAAAGVDVRRHAGVPLRRGARQPHPARARHAPGVLLLPRQLHRHRHEEARGVLHRGGRPGIARRPLPLQGRLRQAGDRQRRRAPHLQHQGRPRERHLPPRGEPGAGDPPQAPHQPHALREPRLVGGREAAAPALRGGRRRPHRSGVQRRAQRLHHARRAGEVRPCQGLRQGHAHRGQRDPVVVRRRAAEVREETPRQVRGEADERRGEGGAAEGDRAEGRHPRPLRPPRLVHRRRPVPVRQVPRPPQDPRWKDRHRRVSPRAVGGGRVRAGRLRGVPGEHGKAGAAGAGAGGGAGGKYLAQLLKKVAAQNAGKARCFSKKTDLGDPFVYKHMGSMASVGRYKALVDLRASKGSKGISMAGFVSWLVWRSAYLTRVVSWRNRFYVAVNWATTLVFGRDNTRIG